MGVFLLLLGAMPPFFLIRRGHLPTSPLVLIWVSQTIPLGIALMNFTGEMNSLRLSTWVVLSTSFAAILGGWATAMVMSRSGTSPHVRELSESRLTIGVALLSAVYFLSIYQGVLQTGGFPLLMADPGDARWKFMVGRLQNVLFAAGIPLFIVGIHLFRITGSWVKRTVIVCILVALAATYLLIGSRFVMLVWLSMTLVYWDQVVKRIPIMKLVLVLAIFLVLFSLIGYIRYGKMLAAATGSSKVVKIGSLLAVQSVYTYIANAYWNLDYALFRWDLGQLVWPTWGFSTNEGVLWVLKVGPEMQKAYNWANAMNKDVALQAGLNSTTYHWGLIKDFGLAGPLFGSFLMGWFFTMLHRTRCKRGSPAWIMIYGLFSYFLLGSFNLLPSVIPTPIFGMLWLAGTLYLCSVPSRDIKR